MMDDALALPRTWTFAVGIGQVRKVTVRGSTQETARVKAAMHEDRLAEKQGREAPVAWSLTLIRCKLIKPKAKKRLS